MVSVGSKFPTSTTLYSFKLQWSSSLVELRLGKRREEQSNVTEQTLPSYLMDSEIMTSPPQSPSSGTPFHSSTPRHSSGTKRDSKLGKLPSQEPRIPRELGQSQCLFLQRSLLLSIFVPNSFVKLQYLIELDLSNNMFSVLSIPQSRLP